MKEQTLLAPKYQPQDVERGKYKDWIEQGYFHADATSEKTPYSVVIPPPNVTGKLHLGHAWDTTLQDMIIRQKRMQGFDALWLPGMDHAGIATQAKVEERLREEGISRYDLGREAFIDQVWDWKETYAGHIRNQWAKLGLSLDYTRERFTLDEGLSKAVQKVFVDLYHKGLIYRGEYIINWDPKAQTALSDIEVIHKDVEGALYHILYPLVDDETAFIEVATSRPETLLGDTAIAVHPEDPRYQSLIGKEVYVPLIQRKIPIIADEYVDLEFGTGAVKITPAHDPNDFEVGNRHNLPRINVLDDQAVMNQEAGPYEGMDRFKARKAIVQDLKEQQLLKSIEPITHSVGHSERTGVVVEPRLSTQWFVKMKPLAEQAIQNQESDQAIHFYPPRFNQTFINWMENVHDWVISRQLWWGHRIPAWYHQETGEVYVGLTPPEGDMWVQDPDVLDTWFSSALWPFSTLGWPDETDPDYLRYFPIDTLVTGYDIIFFWVSRMIFQSLEFTQKIPFKNVLIHGLIRAEDGRKMSKSLGNGIDPMEVIDQYGADALRWFLATGSTPGQDMRFSYEKMDAAWNFINKIWNASRYVLMNLEDTQELDMTWLKHQKEAYTLADRWILTRLTETIKQVTQLTEKFEFGEAGRYLYNFIWDEFCDWYIEMSKEVLYGDNEHQKRITQHILAYVLDHILRLLHPIMPFVTEEIWGQLPQTTGSIVCATYPNDDEHHYKDIEAVNSMTILMELIRSVRNIRSESNVPLSQPISLYINCKTTDVEMMLIHNKASIERFCNPEALVIGQELNIPDQVKSAVITDAEVYIPLLGLIDVEAEQARLQQEIDKWQSEVARVQKKLSNEQFIQKAPDAVVQAEREKEQDYLDKLSSAEKQLAHFIEQFSL